MASTTHDARLLARELTVQLGVSVSMTYDITARTRARSGWTMRWADGPDEDTMHALVAELESRYPAVHAGRLRYDRTPAHEPLQ